MALQELFSNALLKVAEQPKNNQLDMASVGDVKVLLFPIDHDYPGGSAAMHNAVFAQYDLPYRSCFVVGDPYDVGEIFAVLKADPNYIGGGAGSGFKDKVAPHLDGLDKSAQAIGSVNVIAREDGKLIGYNTDGVGFVNGLLEEYPDCIRGQKIVILGAGGTSLPIAYEMAQNSPSEIVICNRTVAKAEHIAELISPFVSARGTGEDNIAGELANAGIVVNTSNKGAQPNEAYSAFAAMTGDAGADMAVSLSNVEALPSSAIVADILLEPETTTLRMAVNNGNRTHSGQHMNLHQAVPAFKIMTKLDKPSEDLAATMRAAL
jgi:shikimate dehydrogenase